MRSRWPKCGRQKFFTGDASERLDLGQIVNRNLFPLADRGGLPPEVFGKAAHGTTIRFEVIFQRFHGANFSQNEISVKKKFQSNAMV